MKSPLGKLKEAYDKLVIFQHEMSAHGERIAKVADALANLNERVTRLEEQQKTMPLLVEKEVSRQLLDMVKSRSRTPPAERKKLKPGS